MHATDEGFALSLRCEQRVALNGGLQGPGGRVGSGPRDLGSPARGREPDAVLGARGGDGYAATLRARRHGCGRREWDWPRRWSCMSPHRLAHASGPDSATPACVQLPRDTSALAFAWNADGGMLLLVFVVYHLLHLTAGILHPHFTPGHVYDNVVVAAAAHSGRRDLRRRGRAPRAPPAPRPVGRDAQLGVRPDVAARRRVPPVAVLSAAIAAGFARCRSPCWPDAAMTLEVHGHDASRHRTEWALAGRWQRRRNELELVARREGGNISSSWWAPGWPVPRRRPRWVSSATACAASPSTTRPAGLTAWPRRAASMPRGTRRTTATASSGSSTTRWKAATSGRRESNVYRLAELSARIIDHAVAQGVPSPASTAGTLRPGRSRGARLAHVLRARADRSAAPARRLTRRSARKWRGEASRCCRGARCSTWSWSTDGARASSPATWCRRAGGSRGRCRGPRDRRLCQRLLPVDQTQGHPTHRHLASAPARRASQPGLRAVPSHGPAGGRRASGQAHAHVGVAA